MITDNRGYAVVGMGGTSVTEEDYKYAYLLPKPGEITRVEIAIDKSPSVQNIVFTIHLGPASPSPPYPGLLPPQTALTGTIEAGSGEKRLTLNGAPVPFAAGQNLILVVETSGNEPFVVNGVVELVYSE